MAERAGEVPPRFQRRGSMIDRTAFLAGLKGGDLIRVEAGQRSVRTGSKGLTGLLNVLGGVVLRGWCVFRNVLTQCLAAAGVELDLINKGLISRIRR